MIAQYRGSLLENARPLSKVGLADAMRTAAHWRSAWTALRDAGASQPEQDKTRDAYYRHERILKQSVRYAVESEVKSKSLQAPRGVHFILGSAPEFNLKDEPVLGLGATVIEAMGFTNVAGDGRDRFHCKFVKAQHIDKEHRVWRSAWQGKLNQAADMIAKQFPNAKIVVVTLEGGDECNWECNQIDTSFIPYYKTMKIERLHFMSWREFMKEMCAFIVPEVVDDPGSLTSYGGSDSGSHGDQHSPIQKDAETSAYSRTEAFVHPTSNLPTRGTGCCCRQKSKKRCAIGCVVLMCLVAALGGAAAAYAVIMRKQVNGCPSELKVTGDGTVPELVKGLYKQTRIQNSTFGGRAVYKRDSDSLAYVFWANDVWIISNTLTEDGDWVESDTDYGQCPPLVANYDGWYIWNSDDCTDEDDDDDDDGCWLQRKALHVFDAHNPLPDKPAGFEAQPTEGYCSTDDADAYHPYRFWVNQGMTVASCQAACRGYSYGSCLGITFSPASSIRNITFSPASKNPMYCHLHVSGAANADDMPGWVWYGGKDGDKGYINGVVEAAGFTCYINTKPSPASIDKSNIEFV